MSPQPQSDRDQVTYRTYDGRLVSRASIDRVLAELDNRARREARVQRLRGWLFTALLSLILLAAVVILIWRLATAV